MARDANYKKLMNSRTWRNLRAAKLSASPWCQRCQREGRMTLAHEVHHIVPVQSGIGMTQMRQLAYSPDNLQSLCHDCHVRTHTDMGRRDAQSEKRRRERETAEYLRKFYGIETPGGVFSERGEGS